MMYVLRHAQYIINPVRTIPINFGSITACTKRTEFHGINHYLHCYSQSHSPENPKWFPTDRSQRLAQRWFLKTNSSSLPPQPQLCPSFSSWNLHIPPPGEQQSPHQSAVFLVNSGQLGEDFWRVEGAEGLTVSVTQVASTLRSFLSYSNERTSSVVSKTGKSLILEIFN